MLKQALRYEPGSVYINLLLARCNYKKGDTEGTRRHFSVVKEGSPEVALSYSYLLVRKALQGRPCSGSKKPSSYRFSLHHPAWNPIPTTNEFTLYCLLLV